MSRPPGKHAPATPLSFYASVGRHLIGGIAIVAVVALVVVLATSDDDGAGLRVTPSASTTPTEDPSASPSASPATPSASPTRDARSRAEITVVVLNGTSRAGLASQTKERFVAAGYTVIRIGNTPAPVAKTTVFYRPGAVPEAELVLDDFPDFIRIAKASDADASTDAILTVVLGDDYRV